MTHAIAFTLGFILAGALACVCQPYYLLPPAATAILILGVLYATRNAYTEHNP